MGRLVTDATRVPALDGLRAIAILLVIPHNVGNFGVSHDWTRLTAVLAHAGWIGVQLFFVLSGYLITRGLMQSLGRADYYRSFFRRRVLRIFPLYFLTLILFLVVLPVIVQFPSDVLATYRNQWPLWCFLNNWTQSSVGSVYWFPHYWSLAVEEQFYFVWPFVIAAAGERRMLGVALGIVIVAVLARALAMVVGMPGGVEYLWTICRMDALALGAALAVLLRSTAACDWMRARALWILTAGAAILLLTGLATRGFAVESVLLRLAGFTAISLGFVSLVAVAVVGGDARVVRQFETLLSTRCWRSVAQVSFAMYLFHVPIARVMDPWLSPVLRPLGTAAPVMFCLIVAAVSYCAGWISYQLLERHCLRVAHFAGPAAPTVIR